ncbi:30S ribosomal protein S8e [Candidatus Woesearchaeota archaeon]|nr:30S ribosomal protein S8e [Candidatus Woesearchaeota archaeon]
MVVIQARSKKKPTGARIRSARKKRHFEAGHEPTLTKIGDRKVKKVRSRGGSGKMRGQRFDKVNVADGKVVKQAVIKTVVENPANRHFVRRNILTKGTIVDTDMGKAKITNQPGQSAVLNAVLVKEKTK